MTDNGSEFTNGKRTVDGHPYEMLLESMEIEHRYIPPYHPQTNGKIERFCRKHGFKKTWGDVYVSQAYDINKTWNGSMRSGDIVKCKHTSSTRKYVDADGESVRCTKEHILFCLDKYPEIADEIEQRYGIMRMTTDYVRNIVLWLRRDNDKPRTTKQYQHKMLQ